MGDKQATVRLRGLYKVLIATARSLGYKFHLVGGESGTHTGFPGQKKIIEVGKDQPLPDKIVYLAHEIGHALDFIHDTPKVGEVITVLKNWEAYRLSDKYYQREKSAWRHAKSMLENMKGYKVVKVRFGQLRTRGLASYYKQMRSNQLGNSTTD